MDIQPVAFRYMDSLGMGRTCQYLDKRKRCWFTNVSESSKDRC